VAQTGVQILFAFLLTLPLQNRFEKLDDWEIKTFVVALLLSAGASVCLIAPVAYHRALFARKVKRQVVTAAARFAIVGLALLAMAITCAVDLVLDLVLGRIPALIISGLLGLVLVLAWAVLPLLKRRAAELANNVVPEPRSDSDGPESDNGGSRAEASVTGRAEPAEPDPVSRA